MSVQLSIIIVNWNTKDLLRGCLESVLRETKSIESEITVVDNASSDRSCEMVEAEFPQIQLIKNEENLGFAKANNQAIAKAKGEFILLLNPDTVVCENSLEKMLRFMQSNLKVGIIGPKMLNPDRTLQVSCHAKPGLVFSSLSWFISGMFYEKLCLSKNEEPAEVGYVSGACLLIRRKTIDAIGLLDENFFIYAEEADWCMRAEKENWKVYFIPEAEIIHYAKESAKKYGLVAMSKIRAQSNYFLIRKHFGKFKADLFCFLVAILATTRKVFWRVCLIFDRKDKQAIEEKLKIYNSILEGIRLGRKQ